MQPNNIFQRLSTLYKLLRRHSEGLQNFEDFFGGFAIMILSALESQSFVSASMILEDFAQVWKKASTEQIEELKRRAYQDPELDIDLLDNFSF